MIHLEISKYVFIKTGVIFNAYSDFRYCLIPCIIYYIYTRYKLKIEDLCRCTCKSEMSTLISIHA